MGIALFSVSEVFFFVSILWAFFHSSLTPVVEIGYQWPPVSIVSFNTCELPLLNTVLLLSSDASVTYTHHALIGKNRKYAIIALIFTLVFAVLFTILYVKVSSILVEEYIDLM